MPLVSPAPNLTMTEVWNWFVDAPLQIVVTLVVALVLRFVAHKAISKWVALAERRHERRLAGVHGLTGFAERALAQAAGLDHERYVQRTRTIGSVLRSIVTATIGGIALLTIMAIMGIPLAPLLASAGVGGVALGFGAQSLVKDFLSGVFMILEDQYGVGDVIDTGGLVGTVEDVSLRVTRLRDGDGVAWYVRNGEILRLGNKSQGWSMALVDIPVSYEEPIEKALAIVRSVADGFEPQGRWEGKLLERPNVVGVESMAGGVVTIRIVAKCAPGANFDVQRELREAVKAAFDKEGVKGPNPFPKSTFGTGGGQ